MLDLNYILHAVMKRGIPGRYRRWFGLQLAKSKRTISARTAQEFVVAMSRDRGSIKMVTARRSHNNYACTAVIRATGGHCYEGDEAMALTMYVSACRGLALMVDRTCAFSYWPPTNLLSWLPVSFTLRYKTSHWFRTDNQSKKTIKVSLPSFPSPSSCSDNSRAEPFAPLPHFQQEDSSIGTYLEIDTWHRFKSALSQFKVPYLGCWIACCVPVTDPRTTFPNQTFCSRFSSKLNAKKCGLPLGLEYTFYFK